MKKIKIKLMIGILIVFFISFTVFLLNITSNYRVVNQSQSILADNYPSIKFTHEMLQIVDLCNEIILETKITINNLENSDSAEILLNPYLIAIDTLINQQKKNITEKGEEQLTSLLQLGYLKFSESLTNKEYKTNYVLYKEKYINLRETILNIYDLNINILEQKNLEIQSNTAQILHIQEKTGTIGLAILCILLVVLPFYLINPIDKLTMRMHQFYKQNFNEDIKFESDHELEKLEEIFEKILLKQAEKK